MSSFKGGKWLQFVDGAWQDISDKLANFKIDNSGCSDLCTLIWDGQKLISVFYTTKEIKLTVGSEEKLVKVEALCQYKPEVPHTKPKPPGISKLPTHKNLSFIKLYFF